MTDITDAVHPEQMEHLGGIPPLAKPKGRLPLRIALALVISGSVACAATVLLVNFHRAPATSMTAADEPAPFDEPSHTLVPKVFVAPRGLFQEKGESTLKAKDEQAATLPAALLALPVSQPGATWRIQQGALAPPADQAQFTNPAPPRVDGLMVDVPAPAAPDASKPHASVRAERHRSSALTLSAGSIIGCALETAINSQRPGLVTCVVTEDVVSDDARVTLIERGTHVLGSYRADIHLGDSRVNVVWDRLRKADGTTVDLESPGVDAQGSSGLSGVTDNHWFDRIGAAVLLSLIQDSVADLTQPKANGSAVIFANTANAGPALSQKVLDATINIAPTITVAAGARINILVARDIDFSGVYGAH